MTPVKLTDFGEWGNNGTMQVKVYCRKTDHK